MRIKLKRGFQKKLVLFAKKNHKWRELAKELRINPHYLANEIKNEKRLISEKNYRKLCNLSNINFDNEIEEKLHDFWGKSKGGRKSRREPKLLVKNYSTKLAELIGIILGDGNLWDKNNSYCLTIAGNKITDKNYLINYVKPLMEDLFKTNVRTKKSKKQDALYLIISRKDIIYTLYHYGLLSGNKLDNNVGIPKWILKDKKYTRACIRGLIDTDGSVCPITGRNYSYIWFTSRIPNIRKGFDMAMRKLNIKTSKWNMKKGGSPEIFIGAKDQISKYLREISFKNNKHLARIMLS